MWGGGLYHSALLGSQWHSRFKAVQITIAVLFPQAKKVSKEKITIFGEVFRMLEERLLAFTRIRSSEQQQQPCNKERERGVCVCV